MTCDGRCGDSSLVDRYKGPNKANIEISDDAADDGCASGHEQTIWQQKTEPAGPGE